MQRTITIEHHGDHTATPQHLGSTVHAHLRAEGVDPADGKYRVTASQNISGEFTKLTIEFDAPDDEKPAKKSRKAE